MLSKSETETGSYDSFFNKFYTTVQHYISILVDQYFNKIKPF